MKPTLLIVDDERGIVDTMRAYFSPQYEILTAYSGQEAIQKAEKQPDLILLDINMPGLSDHPGPCVLPHCIFNSPHRIL